MARRVKEVMITQEGRDKGKLFLLTEMSAADAEDWAARGLLALAHSGQDLGDLSNLGMQGIAILGIQALAKLKYDELKPLMDDMWKCVQIIPDPSGNRAMARALVDNDIEEIATRIQLRAEVINLHTGFSNPAGPSTTSPTNSRTDQAGSQITRISRPRSGSAYRTAKPR